MISSCNKNDCQCGCYLVKLIVTEKNRCCCRQQINGTEYMFFMRDVVGTITIVYLSQFCANTVITFLMFKCNNVKDIKPGSIEVLPQIGSLSCSDSLKFNTFCWWRWRSSLYLLAINRLTLLNLIGRKRCKTSEIQYTLLMMVAIGTQLVVYLSTERQQHPPMDVYLV